MPTKKASQRTSVSARAGKSKATNNQTSAPPSVGKKAAGKKNEPQKSSAKKTASANKAATTKNAARADKPAGKQTASKKQSAAKKQTSGKRRAASKPAARQGLFAKTKQLAGEIIVGAVTGAARGAVRGAVEPLEEAAGITAEHHDEDEESEAQKDVSGQANKT